MLTIGLSSWFLAIFLWGIRQRIVSLGQILNFTSQYGIISI